MPPLNKLKSGAFTLEFKRKLPQDTSYTIFCLKAENFYNGAEFRR